MQTEHIDGWANTMTSMGSIRDKSTALTFLRRERLSREVLETMYEQNPIAARVVDRLVDDAFRNGWTITKCNVDIDHAAIMSRLDELQVNTQMARAARWSRLYGGALLCVPTVDATRRDQVLINPTAIYPLTVVAAHDAIPQEYDDGFGSPTYQKVLSYDIQGLTSTTARVHHSRVIAFEPIELPPAVLLRSITRWGPSVIDRLFDDLGREGSARAHAVSMMYIASLLFLQLQGFREDHNSKQGRVKLAKFMGDVRRTLDSLGVMGLDVNDKIGTVTLQTSGVHELIDRMRDALAAAADMPKEILFNESPAGLNAGELSGPQEIWFATVRKFQTQVLTPALDRVLEICFQVWGIPATEWQIEWAPLWTPSQTAIADNAAKWATTDKAYFDMGLDGEEIVKQRFVEGRTGPLELAANEPAVPLDIAGEAAAEVAAQAPATTPADTAMNGAQIASMLEILKSVNIGELTYDQGIGALGVAFASLRGREAAVLGPRPAVAPVNPTLPAPAAAVVDEPNTDPPPSPDAPPPDPASPRDAAAKWGVPTLTLTRLIRSGVLPYWGIGSRVIVSLSEVGRLAKSHEASIAA